MSVAEALLRTLVPFPKLLIAIAKRCSSATSNLLRYLFSLWNASAQKWKREHSLEDDADPSRLPGIGAEAGASVESATTLCSEDEGSASGRRLLPYGTETPAAMLSAEGRGSNLSIPQPSGSAPPISTVLLLLDLWFWFISFDRPGFIKRSLRATRSHHHTDGKEWIVFSQKFQNDVDNVTLLATVLLSGNPSFLSLIAQNGLSYSPERLSYSSLLSALGSIWVGLAVHTPRFLPDFSIFCFEVMVCIPALPSVLFLYSTNTVTEEELFEIYHNNVGLSVYEDYPPVISRFFEPTCNKSSVENLMAPGLPVFIAHSSGTSGGAAKYLPKYRHPDHMSRAMTETVRLANPQSKNGTGKNCIIFSLAYRQVVTPLDEDGDMAKHIPVFLLTSGLGRIENNMPVERDDFAATLKIPNYSSPIAVSFISNYKSFLFMHALFALVEPKLETINSMSTTSCRDLCRTVDDHWDNLIHCIETGVIPDVDGIEGVKDNLQRFLQPNPDRAEELRKIGKATDTPGWFRQIWPQLRAILANASGPFATVVPEIRHYIGPEVSVKTLAIASSEAYLAVAYGPRDLNLYKVVGSDDVIEFLPVDDPEESKYLAQSWNVESGKKYEVVLTTRDGFWRYRLGDVVEIVVFDPRGTTPYQRRNMHIHLANEVTTETQLRQVVDATSDLLGRVSEFCVSSDYRQAVARYAFTVELQGNAGGSRDILWGDAPSRLERSLIKPKFLPGVNISVVPDALHDQLQKHNENYLKDSRIGKIGIPCVRVVRPGTFSDFREWKVRTKGAASGQVKVPVVIWGEADRAWLEGRPGGERLRPEAEPSASEHNIVALSTLAPASPLTSGDLEGSALSSNECSRFHF
ncbi:GH3 auxin-responsive promoter-domain-containing protein [Pisolithus orientalis]|uniref:GH3 auxin-responsive promoter-domain-containing protein n=1 Tax=Pisolithus orientalis TaxID=936130 RepID=UPI002224D598|nr:GH3 auxin-responsive promoter-domain-containing protein [Pisolithus orientalis]KAI5998366.1 GH3 auxin-responsive promoter-domain-containing protein [Pisolithus orientalis]